MVEDLKPCPYSRLPGKHYLQVLPLDLGDMGDYSNTSRSKAHYVGCSCLMRGPVGPTYEEAIRRHNEGMQV